MLSDSSLNRLVMCTPGVVTHVAHSGIRDFQAGLRMLRLALAE